MTAATLDAPITIAPPVTPSDAAARQRWLGYSAVVASTVLNLLDSTVVSVGAPAIQADLGGSYATLQWMSAGYTLALAVLLLVGGRLGDMVGRKRMLMTGVAGFTVTSLLCALSVSPEMLVASRVLQGAFGAMLLPQGFGLIRDLFPPAEMRKAFAIFGPLMGFGAMLGPIVGGTLLDADVFGTGWRMLFLVNLPVGIAALALAVRFLPSVAPSAPGVELDVPAVLYAGTGLSLLIFPLVQGHELGWPAWTFALLAGSIPAFALFARRQTTTVRAGRSPLVLPSLFRNRTYLAGIGFAIAFFAAMGAMFTVGMLLQIGLGFTAMQASLTMSPWAVGAMVGSAISGMLVARLGRTLLHAGVALMGLGVAGLAIAYVVSGAGLDLVTLAVPLLVGGAGMGMIFVPMFDIILAGVNGPEIGSATGVLGAMEQLGITLGIAILGTVFFGIIGHQPTAGSALHAGVVTALVTLAMLVVTFVVGFALPRKVAGNAH